MDVKDGVQATLVEALEEAHVAAIDDLKVSELKRRVVRTTSL